MGDFEYTSWMNIKTSFSPNKKRTRCNSSSTAEQILEKDRTQRRLQPDNPIHVPRDSIMSSHKPRKPRNFEGFINWGFLLLSIGGIRLFLENLNRYGVRVDPVSWLETCYRFIDTHENFQMLWLVGYMNVPIVMALFLEKMFASGSMGHGKKGLLIFYSSQLCNIVHTILLPMMVLSFYSYEKPLSIGEILPIYAIHATYIVLAMKLISYVHVNHWARSRSYKRKNTYKPTTCGVIPKCTSNTCTISSANTNDEVTKQTYDNSPLMTNVIENRNDSKPTVEKRTLSGNVESQPLLIRKIKKIIMKFLVVKLTLTVLLIVRRRLDNMMKRIRQFVIKLIFSRVGIIDIANCALQCCLRVLSYFRFGRSICAILNKSVMPLFSSENTHESDKWKSETASTINFVNRKSILDDKPEDLDDTDSIDANKASTIVTDSSLPSTWNERDTDMGLESSITTGTSTTQIDDVNREEDSCDGKESKQLSAQYKTLLWLSSLMLKNESSGCSNKPCETKDKTFGCSKRSFEDKEEFQIITSKMIQMTSFKNRCRRRSLCEAEMKAFTQNELHSHHPTYTDKIHLKTSFQYAKKLVKYPNNLTMNDIYYFMLAPTLCYELNFPRSGRIRKSFLFRRALEVIIGINLLMALAQQWIIPSVVNSLIPFNKMNLGLAAERMLKLAIPNHLIWLTSAYLLFHSYLNTLAEILQFADRLFYKEWWNAANIGIFWRTWNIPVHQWFVRHVYKPILGCKGCTKTIATTVVFLVSAILHEYVISVPLQMFKAYAFLGMFLQIPLMRISTFAQERMGNRWGNVIVWMSLIIGQPLAVLMYYHDFVVQHYGHLDIQQFADLHNLDAMQKTTNLSVV